MGAEVRCSAFSIYLELIESADDAGRKERTGEMK